MKPFTVVLCCAIFLKLVVAQYQWACTEPDNNGLRHIPSERNPTGVTAVNTNANEVHIYRVGNLTGTCYGKVTAIEYCYRYNVNGDGQPVFNWTVLILDEIGDKMFNVTNIFVIASHPNVSNCEGSGQQMRCCEAVNITDFNLPVNFVFGVTESAQGNTYGATLLGFFDSQYWVDTVLLNRAAVTLSVCSVLVPSTPVISNRGLRMLWFVVDSGELMTGSTPITCPPTPDSKPDSTRNGSGLTSITSTESTNNGISGILTSIGTMDNEQSVSTFTVSQPSPVGSNTGYAVGGAVGGLMVVIVVAAGVIVIVLLVVKRGWKGSMKVEANSIGAQAFSNAVYDKDGPGGSSDDPKVPVVVASESVDFNNVSYDYIDGKVKREDLGHEYSLPTDIHGSSLIKPPAMKQSTLPSLESSGKIYTTAYEVPTSLQSYSTINQDEDIYMVPATDESSLYSQLSQINISNIKRGSLELTKLLGSGQFGNVHQGEWTAPGTKDKVDVAVKTLKKGVSEEDTVKFLQEAAIMGQFRHPNVVQLHGVITEGGAIMLVIELLPNGDLREILCNTRTGQSSEVKIDDDLPHTLLSWCRQVASGMQYLANKAFVHRDLAARNILVSEDCACKIADFGMSRDLVDENYYVSHGGKVPVKWTAPEAIHFRKYSTASDVWSFGCVMYEIWSLGHKPFEEHTNLECLKLVDKGIRLPPPPGCPRTIYKLMIDCWHPDSSSRPNFVSLVQRLSLPDTKLLKWIEEDKATDPEAATLGAGLIEAVDLYKDLQEQYCNNIII